MPVRAKKDMDRSELCSDGYFAFVYGIALTYRYDGGAGADGMYGTEWCHIGDPEIGCRVGCHFFYTDDLDGNLFARLHRGRFDVQAVMESDIPLVYIGKSGVRVKKTAEEKEEEDTHTCFFHKKCLFYYGMQREKEG